MTIPLILLALGATFAGLAGLPMVEGTGEFWRGSIVACPSTTRSRRRTTCRS